jgi:cytoskeletal protein CcmA (bactofilin family)
MRDASEDRAGMEPDTSHSRITRSLLIRGEVSGREPTQIFGRVEGRLNFEQALLTVEREGEVKAEIRADELVVLGSVCGNTQGQRLEVRGGGEVIGDVVADAITLEYKGMIRGRIDLPGRQAPAVDIRALSLLVLEDENKALSRMLRELELNEYPILTACTPNAAWRLFESGSIALVLMDAVHAGDGLGAAMKRAHPTVPVVVLSENWSALEELAFADLLLSKSIGRDRLRVHLRALLGATHRQAA